LPVIPGRLRTEYLEQFGQHVDAMGRRLGENRFDYVLADTSQPLDRLLFEFLVRRERMRTVR
jgi:hypothetical protein